MPAIRLPVVVEFDIPVTRRTRIHAVLDGQGNQLFHSRSLTQVLEFLIENDVGTFELIDDDHAYVLKLSRPPPRPLTEKGDPNG